jgi:mRNA interferase MazF
MTYKQGDVILINFPYTSGKVSKKRPGLILSSHEYNSNRQECIIAPITSQNKSDIFLGDYVIVDWKKAGLYKPSLVKCIIFTLEESMIEKTLGHFENKDLKSIIKIIHSIVKLNEDINN